MTKAKLFVQTFMSSCPQTIGADQTLSHAHALMREHGVRHLPVLHAGRLVGMLTQRDLALVETFKDVDPARIQVEEAMSQEVYTVAPETPLEEVAREMADKKYGSAVILEKGKVVGIFTTVDVCRALSALLEGRLEA